MFSRYGFTFLKNSPLSKCVWFGISLLALSGCASPPLAETENLVDISTKRTISLAKPVSWMLEKDFEQGLAAGTYVAEKENNFGTFFAGPGKAFFEHRTNSRYIVYEGGFWISKSTDIPPRLYFKQLTEQMSDGVPNAQITTAILSTPNATVLQSGLAGGIAGGVVAALAASERGQIRLLPPLRDEKLVRELMSAARPPQ